MGSAIKLRLPLLALAVLALLAALWAGLVRLGWPLPALRPTLPMAHGPLMVSGFLGTLIILERAVALTALGRARWSYAGPLLAGLGGLLTWLGVAGPVGPLLITLAGMVLVGVMLEVFRLHPALHAGVMGLGAVSWLVGSGLWLAGQPVWSVSLWWAGFLVLTIVGERLELSRLLQLSRPALVAFLLGVVLFLAGLLLSAVSFKAGMRLAGVGMIALALWLLHFDMARRTLRRSPGSRGGEGTELLRFIAICLLAGYGWLAVAGALGLAHDGTTAGLRYDAVLHALFVGFVFSMIFGHAPIVFQGVLGVHVPFRDAFYGHLLLLHASLALRVVSDLSGWLPGRQWGGLLNVAALLWFLTNTVFSVRQARISSG